MSLQVKDSAVTRTCLHKILTCQPTHASSVSLSVYLSLFEMKTRFDSLCLLPVPVSIIFAPFAPLILDGAIFLKIATSWTWITSHNFSEVVTDGKGWCELVDEFWVREKVENSLR